MDTLSTIHENDNDISSLDFPIFNQNCRKTIRTIKSLPRTDIIAILVKMIEQSPLTGDDLHVFLNISKHIIPSLNSIEKYRLNNLVYKNVALCHRYRYVLINIFHNY